MNLDDGRVAVLGDVHGNASWTSAILAAIHRTAPDVRTVLQVGDFWPDEPYLRIIDRLCEQNGIDQILVTLGNHEPWPIMTPLLAHGRPAHVSEHVTLLPRPYRFEVGGRSVLSLGGAASVDYPWRVLDMDWWTEEQITDEMVAQAIAGGRADLMLTHETPESTPVGAIHRILTGNPLGFPTDALEYSAQSRQQIERVWETVRPELLIHGHMHAYGTGVALDGRRVLALNCDEGPGNATILNLTSLQAEPVTVT